MRVVTKVRLPDGRLQLRIVKLRSPRVGTNENAKELAEAALHGAAHRLAQVNGGATAQEIKEASTNYEWAKAVAQEANQRYREDPDG